MENFTYFWSHKRFIFISYRDAELKELRVLQDCYRRAFGEEPTNTLIETDEKGLPKHKTTTTFSQMLPDTIASGGALESYISQMLRCVEQYLKERSKRLAHTGYSNDPINLFCFQIIKACEQLALAEPSDASLKVVNQWYTYLSEIQTLRIFSMAETLRAENTIEALLANLMNFFDCIRKQIRYTLDHYTIADHFSKAVDQGKRTLEMVCKYLLYALSDQDIPLNASLLGFYQKIVSMNFKLWVKNTMQGQSLLHLASEEAIQDLFFPSEPKKLLQEYERHLALPFLDEEGKVYSVQVNTLLSQLPKDLKAKKSKHTNYQGLFLLDRGEISLLASLVEGFGLLERFAKVLTLCREASHFAKSGGELFICVYTHAHVSFLVDSALELERKLFDKITEIHTRADAYYGKLFIERKKNNREDQWLTNFNAIKNLPDKLREQIKTTDHHFHQVQFTLKNIDRVIEKFKKQTRTFISSIEEFADENPWLAVQSKARDALKKPSSSLMVGDVFDVLQHDSSESNTPPQHHNNTKYIESRILARLDSSKRTVSKGSIDDASVSEELVSENKNTLPVNILTYHYTNDFLTLLPFDAKAIIENILTGQEEDYVKKLWPEIKAAFLQELPWPKSLKTKDYKKLYLPSLSSAGKKAQMPF